MLRKEWLILPRVSSTILKGGASATNYRGRCNREKPPCKYFHPPQHLKDQLLINGRNHLALKNAIMQQLPLQPLLQPPTAQLTPAVASTAPYMPALAGHTASSFSPYLSPSTMIPAGMMPADLAAPPPPPQLTSIVHTPIVTQKVPRTDRLEVCREYQRGNCKRPAKGRPEPSECRLHTSCYGLSWDLSLQQETGYGQKWSACLSAQYRCLSTGSYNASPTTLCSRVLYMSPISSDWPSYCCTKILKKAIIKTSLLSITPLLTRQKIFER
ncbi:Protein muscleblind like protein [Argiope bruennichi]|uniref:Protein muscleblind like protein n=1 Tax=Argiope bruennichi TaxID=94029 RepID=A0A8T0FJL2_ARGBR|nr:Protein muscleblind like protein [Argiope bruennichi]